MKIPRFLSWLVPPMDPNPEEFHRWDEAPASYWGEVASLEGRLASSVVTLEVPVVTVHAPSSQAGVASFAGFTTSGEDGDGDGGGRYRCPVCGQWVPLDHTCTPPTPAAVLAAALPVHDLVLTDDQTEQQLDFLAETLVDVGGRRIAHSSTLVHKRIARIEARLRSVA